MLSVYGVPITEAQVLLVTLSRLVATKMEEPILHVKSWVTVQIIIVVVKSYSWILRGDRVPSPLRTLNSDWGLGFVLGLAL